MQLRYVVRLLVILIAIGGMGFAGVSYCITPTNAGLLGLGWLLPYRTLVVIIAAMVAVGGWVVAFYLSWGD